MPRDSLRGSKSNLKLNEYLDRLRTELLSLENELQKFGFERNRGLETYSMREIRKLAEKNKYSKNFMMALRECLDKHMGFYSILHGLDRFKPVKENAATGNVWKISKWMNPPDHETVSKQKLSKFATLLRSFFEALSGAKDSHEFDSWYDDVLRTTYKREYDIYRFAEFLANAYNDYVGSKVVVPDHSDVRKGVEEILPAVTQKKLTDEKFLSFLAKYMNTKYPNLVEEETGAGT